MTLHFFFFWRGGGLNLVLFLHCSLVGRQSQRLVNRDIYSKCTVYVLTLSLYYRPASESVRGSTSSNSLQSANAPSSRPNNRVVPNNNNNNNNEDNDCSSNPPLPRRRSTRHRNYLNRSQLHNAIELPDGYGKGV